MLLGGAAEDSQHLANLRESGKASLATGHIAPPWFIQVGAATRCMASPCRAALCSFAHAVALGLFSASARLSDMQAWHACGSLGAAEGAQRSPGGLCPPNALFLLGSTQLPCQLAAPIRLLRLASPSPGCSVYAARVGCRAALQFLAAWSRCQLARWVWAWTWRRGGEPAAGSRQSERAGTASVQVPVSMADLCSRTNQPILHLPSPGASLRPILPACLPPPPLTCF